jgi:hypothetical protein
MDAVKCGCGKLLQAEDADALRAEAERHVNKAHPELAGTLSPLELAAPRKQIHRAAG